MEEYWELMLRSRELYHRLLQPVCEQCGLTRPELELLLYLAEGPKRDTSADFAERLHYAKSQVSAAVQSLERRGCLSRFYSEDNRKSQHLRLLPPADDPIRTGQAAQADFMQRVLSGFSAQERETMRVNLGRILDNLRNEPKG